MPHLKTLLALVPAVLLSLPLYASSARAGEGKNAAPFFFMGDGKVHIIDMHTGKEVQADLLTPDGKFNEEGFTKVDEVFGFPTREMGEHISPRLLFMLDYFSDLVAPGKPIEMVSGYRSPVYNENLRGKGANAAKTSLHMDGMALDFHIAGVNGKALWEVVKSMDCGGVGWYGGENIHLDSGRPRFWEASTSKVLTGESDYNRRIYLSTDYDRYGAGDEVRLSLVSVSDFGFGVKPLANFVDEAAGRSIAAPLQVEDRTDSECIMINDRRSAHFIRTIAPPQFGAGKCRVRLEFCRRPFEEMPESTLSNVIEVLGKTR